jgi:hypothetical protein
MLVSMSWPSTQGTVLESRWMMTSGSKYSSMSVKVTMRYRYSVADRGYTSDRIAIWGPSGLKPTTHDFIDTHPAGAPVTVYYDPERPGRAVLARAPQNVLSWIFLAAAGASLAASSWCFARLWSTRHGRV